MLNNGVLYNLRYLLDPPDVCLTELAAPLSEQVETNLLETYLREEDEDGLQACPDRYLARCLDGLIIQRHGCDKSRSLPLLELPLSSSIILKKLQAAFELKEEDLHTILTNIDFPVSRSKLSALFYKPGHNNYRIYGDRLPRNFLKDLILRVHG